MRATHAVLAMLWGCLVCWLFMRGFFPWFGVALMFYGLYFWACEVLDIADVKAEIERKRQEAGQ